MTLQKLNNLKTPIGDILMAAGAEGLLLEAQEQTRYALIPLDEDLLDYLIERSPKFREDCQRIRERMHAGKVFSHEEVKKMFQDSQE